MVSALFPDQLAQQQAWLFDIVTLESDKIRGRELLEAACFVQSIFALSTTPHHITNALHR
jgi:hypothetical protein